MAGECSSTSAISGHSSSHTAPSTTHKKPTKKPGDVFNTHGAYMANLTDMQKKVSVFC